MRWGCSGRSGILQAGAARQAGLPALSWAAFEPWKPASPPLRGGSARREGRKNLLRGRHRGTGRGRANEASPAPPKKPGREKNPPLRPRLQPSAASRWRPLRKHQRLPKLRDLGLDSLKHVARSRNGLGQKHPIRAKQQEQCRSTHLRPPSSLSPTSSPAV